jgi:hypothetical protein
MKTIGMAAGLAVGLASGLASAQPVGAARGSSPVTLDVGVFGGVGVRFGEPQLFSVEDRAGFEVGGAVWINPSPRYGFGLEFSHLALGREGAGPGPRGEVEVTRFLNGAWGGLRVDLVHVDEFEGWLGFGPGLIWDTSDASGIANVRTGQPGTSFSCAATDGLHLGLRGTLGAAIALGGGLHLAPEALFEGDQLSTDAIGNCVAGPGTVGVFTFRLGFFFRSDVSRHVR